jgi:glycosyltransferase involved in cell wall biosynthesis
MPQPETLIILSPGFPVNEADSTCLPPQQVFLRALKQNYPDLKIIVIAFEYPFIRRHYHWFGVQVIALGGKNKSGLLRRLNWLRAWHALNKLNKQHLVIGLLSFWFDECAFIAHHFAKRNKLKHYSWLLGQDARPGNRYFKLIKPKGDELIALSDAVQKEVYKNYSILPAHVITGGIDTSLFSNAPCPRDIDILGVGSLIPLKQYGVFIDAIKFISQYIPQVRAVICGKGPEKEKLLQQIKDYGLENNIVLRYEVPHTEALALMQRSKVFLHPSEYEGFGAVLFEALYAGAQVVSFVKPMDQKMEHHHVVGNTEEMQHKVLELLMNEHPDHNPVLPYPIADVAAKIMTLFSQSDKATRSISAAIAANESLVR